jgi:hypothetical protein
VTDRGALSVARFQPGEPVFHPSLGRGAVRSIAGGIVEVRFEDGEIRLISDSFDRMRRVLPWDSGERITPSWIEIHDPQRFLPPLTRGELELAGYFDSALPDGWRIYVRPHLDGDLPSLAILHDEHGGMLWDVVESRTPREVPESQGDPLGVVSGRSPAERLERVRRKIYGMYVPRLGENVDIDQKWFGVIRLGLFFANHSRAEADSFIDGHAHVARIGHGELATLPLAEIVPNLRRRVDIDRTSWAELDQLFSAYFSSPASLESVLLKGPQIPLAKPKPGYEVITGVAGSGKSLVLVHRAVNIASQGRRVLLLTFNRTLTNYISDVRVMVPGRYVQDRITIKHLHGLCVDLIRVHGWPYLGTGALSMGVDRGAESDERYDSDFDVPDQDLFDERLPRRAIEAIERGVPSQYQFDALLIDEAQDISPLFLEVATRLLRGPAPEVVAVTDPAQAIYPRRSALDDEVIRARFGKPKALRVGFRLPRRNVEAANAFSAMWGLLTPQIDPPDEGLGLETGLLAWHQGADEPTLAAKALETATRWLGEPSSRPERIAVLVPSKPFGAAFVQLLAEQDIGANHIFAVGGTGGPMDDSATEPASKNARRDRIRFEQSMKASFSVRDQRMKVSTVQSFKGWESDRLVCVLPPTTTTDPEYLAFLYVALTRSRGDMVFIGSHDAYRLGEILLDRLERGEVSPEIRARFAELHAQATRDLARHVRRSAAGSCAPMNRVQQARSSPGGTSAEAR